MTYDPEGRHWSIMTKSHGGTVSVIRDLTLREAARTYERLDPWYGTTSTSFPCHRDFGSDDGIGSEACSFSVMRQDSDGDIEIREVFGPPGWTGFAPGEVEHWPKQFCIYVDDKGNILPDEYQTHAEMARTERSLREASRQSEKRSPVQTNYAPLRFNWDLP